MSGFVFTPSKGTRLDQNVRDYYLISKTPVRTLRINQPLYSLLRKLEEDNFQTGQFPPDSGNQGWLLQIMLALTQRGYYQLQKIADLETFPLISVIVPAREISQDLIECLESICRLDYPEDKIEVLVVIDGPSGSTLRFPSHKIKRITLEKSAGPASARNIGAAQAGGDILAFLDADCIADKNWLREIVPFFQAGEIGAAGGQVDGFYNESCLDRYEKVSSSLNMGRRILFDGNSDSTLYVPTCNMLVRREVFSESGGFIDGMRLGEDVDFCWRMRKKGCYLLYVPCGTISHKHRNRFFQFLVRRGAYGSSEALLYRTHREKRKKFQIPLPAGLSFAVILTAILTLNPWPLVLLPFIMGIDLWLKLRTLKGINITLPGITVPVSALRSHFSFYYFASFHLVRYYLILLAGLGFLFHPLWFFCAFALLITSCVDFAVKKPKLVYPVYLGLYIAEHAAYQVGVFWGCLKLRYFGSYLPVFKITGV
ncbi:MAG: mycofactocin biosynthesis glycosyltransferase MftF [Dehalococcoidales bacterium]|nr:mycofactocin biosynthesis glycosyltransferase MftF [Dehalococcoidales bacterium]